MKVENNNYIYNPKSTKKTFMHPQNKSIFFSSNPAKIGSNIKNIGLIVEEIKLFNRFSQNYENCYLIYKKTNNGGVFSLYKKNIEKIYELSKILENYPSLKETLERYNCYTIPQVLEKIKEIDYKAAQIFEELRIAECGFIRIKDKKSKDIIISKGYKPYDQDDFIFVEDYFYDKNKGFDSSGRVVATPLFKKLIDSRKRNILAIASAIGNKSYSPANLYFRYGFKPFNRTKEEIEKQIIHTPKGERINPNFSISVYLPDNSIIYEIIKKYHGLDEIDKMYSNWL